MAEYVCNHPGCYESLDLGPGTTIIEPWYCSDHKPLILTPRDDLEAQMARGPHPQTVLPCAMAGCARQRTFLITNQLPTQWWCEDHENSMVKPEPPDEMGAFQKAIEGAAYDVHVYALDGQTDDLANWERAIRERMWPVYKDFIEYANGVIAVDQYMRECTVYEASIKKLRLALEQINPFLKAMGDGDTIEMARTLGIINAVRDEYPL